MKRGKPIHKGTKKFKSPPTAHEPEAAPAEDRPQGVASLRYSYLVNAIQPQFTMSALYTGGRILCGKQFIYACCDNSIIIYDPVKQLRVDTITHPNEQIANFCLNHNESQIVTFTNNYLLRLVDLPTKKQLHCLKINKYFVIDMAFSQNNKFLAIGCVNSFVKILTVSSFKQTHEYKNHRFSVRRVEWHPDQNKLQIASLDEQGNFNIFDYQLNQVVQTVKNFGTNFIFSSTGKSVISCSKDINIWDYNTCKLQKQLYQGTEDIETLCLIDIENAGDMMEEYGKVSTGLLFGGETMELSLINLKDGVVHPIKGLCEGPLMKIMTLKGSPKKIIIVSHEQNIAVVGYTHNNFSLEATLLGYNDEIIDIKFSKSVQDGQFLPQSQLMVVATNSNLLKLIQLNTKTCHLISGHKQIILCLDYSYPYIISSGKDKIIKFWRIDHRSSDNRVNLIANYKGHSQDVTSIVLLATSQKIASVSEDKTIKLWGYPTMDKVDIKSSLFTVVAHEKSINAIRCNHNESLLASCSQDRTIKIWDAENLQMKMVLKGHRRSVWDVAFNKIEKILASVAGDGTVKIWNLVNGECVGTMGEGQALLRVQWLFHNQVVTSSLDGMIRIWDIRKMTSVEFDKHEGKIWSLDVSAMDEKGNCIIASGANDSKIILWKDVTEEKQREKLQEENMNEQDKFIYSRYISEKNYVEAAKIAFQSNLTEMFIKAVGKLLSRYNEQEQDVRLEENELISENITEYDAQHAIEQLGTLVDSLIQTDLPRLLKIIQDMNTTAKHFKLANLLLREVIRLQSLESLVKINKGYTEQRSKAKGTAEEFNQTRSDFEQFLDRMRLLNERHATRLQNYMKKSYWMDYMWTKSEKL